MRPTAGDRLLATLPAGGIGAVVTDPPYASGSPAERRANRTAVEKYQQSGQAHQWPDFAGDQQDQRCWTNWCTEWLAAARQAVRPGGYVLAFTDWRQLPSLTDAFQRAGLVWRNVVVWDKGPGARAAGLGRFRHQAEYVVVGSSGRLPPSRSAHFGHLPGVIHCPIDRSDKHHLCGKPVPLMEQLVTVCPPGEIVCDPFAGSGSTGLAAMRTGRRFLGCEIVPEYHAVACRRLAGEEARRDT